ncbi:MAG: hypothetical protein GTN36_01490 [Candidatus Aenigmarchaeota archaeon]|nr:hypothetical protein [Candidatus Aenigmarchaeota archaeon]
MEEYPKIEEFRCCDCTVNIPKERVILKKIEKVGEYVSRLPKTQIVYECNLRVQNCRKLKSFENSEIVSDYVRGKIKALSRRRGPAKC